MTHSRWALWRFNRRDITPERKLDYDWPRRTSWLRWTLAQDLSEEGKLRRALLEIDGPAFPSAGWWIGAGLLAVVVLENLI